MPASFPRPLVLTRPISLRRRLWRATLWIGAGLALSIFAMAVWLAWQVYHPPSLTPYSDLWLAPAPAFTPAPPAPAPSKHELRVRFLGVSTLLFDDGETALLTDGFFSRPPKSQVLFGRVAPDAATIGASLERAGIVGVGEQAGASRLAAVLVLHSHYDHAMDAPEVARRSGALLLGSESSANVARGWGLAEDRIRVVVPEEAIRFGRFRLRFIPSRHVPTAMTGGTIASPLLPPVHASQYHEGENYSLLLEHDGRTLLVQGSAGHLPGALTGLSAELVFLGVGALGQQSPAYREAYWQDTVAAVGARRVIPIHWDDFSLPLSQALQPLPRPLDDFNRSMDFILPRARAAGVDLKLAPAWVEFAPFAGLEARAP